MKARELLATAAPVAADALMNDRRDKLDIAEKILHQ